MDMLSVNNRFLKKKNILKFCRNIGETPLSDTILCDEEVTYEVIEEGTERKRRKLVSSDGYSYCVKVRTLCVCPVDSLKPIDVKY